MSTLISHQANPRFAEVQVPHATHAMICRGSERPERTPDCRHHLCILAPLVPALIKELLVRDTPKYYLLLSSVH